MSRDSSEDVAAAARRRLEALRRDLDHGATGSGDPARAGPVDTAEADDTDVAGELALAAAGRHLRPAATRAARCAGWLEDRLPTALRGRVGVGTRELVLLVVLAAVGVAVAAVVVLRSGVGSPAGDPRPLSTPARAPKPLVTAAPVPAAAAPAAGAPAAGAGTPAPGAGASVTVDVTGKVRHPRVLTLPAGSRIVDAIRRAGGARPHVDLSSLNLAQVLTDGEQIVVGARAGSAPVAGASTAAVGAGDGQLVHLNTATEQELESLPGVGPVTAQKILQWRTAHGSFSSVNELLEIDGIGDKTLAEIAPHASL